MSQKRQQREEGTSVDDRLPRNSKSFKSVVLEVMNRCRLQHLMEPVLEPLIRRVVKEEVDSALRKYINNMKRSSGKDIQPSESRSLQLRFVTAISLPVFTGTRIEGQGGTIVEVSLVDTLTGEIVSSGLGSSAKVEIVVLEGDFDGDEKDNWTPEEFRNNTVKERDGRRPLLTGDIITTLQDGIGSLGNVMFKDNSSWTRSRKFRLGARLLDKIGDVRVREARSEPFIVRDHRGELYKKHHPPSLSDEVWRLEKIGKDGAFHKRLRKERVNTVKDFLLLVFLDPTKLRNILGAGMSAKMWEITVEHARTCVLDKKSYFYGSYPTNGVVFNVVGQLLGVFSNGQYVDADKLSEVEKADACKLVISAFADCDKIVSFDDESSISSSLSIVQSSSNFPSECSYLEDSISDKISRPSYLEQNASSPDYMQSVFSSGGFSSFDDCLQDIDRIGFPCDESLDYPADNLIYDVDTMNRANEQLPYADIHRGFSALIPCPGVSIDKAQRGWNVLVFVLRWWFSIKRIVARRTRDRELPRYCE
ncbi:hypothetical protein ACS0TY_034714 [Phlomoides rotata]